MRLQLVRKFLDDANEEHCLPLPRVAFYPQKPRLVAMLPISEVLIIVVVKNPFVRIPKQIIFPSYKGHNLCLHIGNIQLLHDLALRRGKMHIENKLEVCICFVDFICIGSLSDVQLGVGNVFQTVTPAVEFDQIPQMLESRISIICAYAHDNVLEKLLIQAQCLVC